MISAYQYFSAFDLMGTPVSMNALGKEKAKTRFGALCSVLFFGFVIWAIYNASQDLFSTSNPKIISYDLYKDNPRTISMSRDAFPIAIGMQTPASMGYLPFKDESIFTVEVSYLMNYLTFDSNGVMNQNYTATKIKTETCTREYFEGQASTWAELDLGNLYCISENQPDIDKLEVQGFYTSPVSQFIFIQINICNNATSNDTCAPPEKINEYLTGSWININYVNMVVNPQDYKSPNNSFKDLYQTMISPDNYRETEIDLGYVEVSTDSGWLTEMTNKKTFTKVNKVSEYLQTIPNSDGMIIQVTLKASQLETYCTRSYKKVQEVLAEVGGIVNAALTILIIVTGPFRKLKFLESLINELFHFDLPKKPQRRKKQKQTSYKDQKDQPQLHKQRVKLDQEKEDKEDKKVPLADLGSPNVTQMNSPSNYKDQIKISFDVPTMPELVASDEECNVKRYPTTLESTLFKPRHSILSTEQEKDKKRLFVESQKQEDTSIIGIQCNTVKNRRVQKRQVSSTEIQFIKADLNSPSEDASPESRMDQLRATSNNEEDLEQKSHAKGVYQFEMLNMSKEEEKKPEDEQEVNLESVEKYETHFAIATSQPNQDEEKQKAKLEDSTLNKMNVGILEYIRWLLFKPKELRKKGEILEEGIKLINDRLDVVNVIKKLREIDKLKVLLLDYDQLVLFNNMPKPVIQRKKPVLSRLKTAEYVDLLHSTRFLDDEKVSENQLTQSVNELTRKAQKTAIDKRLIEIFGKRETKKS